MTDEPIYREEDGLWIPRPEAKGPFPGQHGGAFGAAIASAMERWALDHDAGRPVQFTLNFLRPTPVEPIRITVEVVQSGRRVSVLRGEIHADGKCTAFATGIFTQPSPVPTVKGIQPDVRDPLDSVPLLIHKHIPPPWFRDSVEMRRAADGTVWMRPTIPPVAPLTPLARVVAHADWGSGVARPETAEAPQVSGFPNTELTVHLVREPVGEWIGLQGEPIWQNDGIGLTTAVLRDVTGPIGRSAQSLILLPLTGSRSDQV
ncbi:MAG: hypothetical protein GKS00_25130 [Alphaproteobacteria bacterium]|nr:hypothetical protein [Alphaproteobacteria bacterium]